MKTLKENNFEYTWGNVTVKLANSYGFCWGVERAVQIAYEARRQFPEQKLWITNEIIHNPTVNEVSDACSRHAKARMWLSSQCHLSAFGIVFLLQQGTSITCENLV